MIYVYAMVEGDCPELGVVCQESEVPAEAERKHSRPAGTDVLGCVVDVAMWLDVAVGGGYFLVFCSDEVAPHLEREIRQMVRAVVAGRE